MENTANPPHLTLEEAETVALRAIGFIAADDDALAGLLRTTGIDGTTLRNGLETHAIQAGVLSFLLQNETRLLKFCEMASLSPLVPMAAEECLSKAS